MLPELTACARGLPYRGTVNLRSGVHMPQSHHRFPLSGLKLSTPHIISVDMIVEFIMSLSTCGLGMAVAPTDIFMYRFRLFCKVG